MAGYMTAQNQSIYSMSKHAVISFSNALRIENRMFGVRVSTIEPIAYKTPMCTEEYFNREIDGQWSDSSEDVKQFYGEECLRSLKRLKEKAVAISFPPSDKIHEVVDRVVDAIRNPEPETRYPSIPGFVPKIIIFLMNFIPIELYDQLVYKMNKDIFPVNFKIEK